MWFTFIHVGNTHTSFFFLELEPQLRALAAPLEDPHLEPSTHVGWLPVPGAPVLPSGFLGYPYTFDTHIIINLGMMVPVLGG